jgi:5-methylcytosine-specific restriction endonuclease McrA
MSFSSIPHSLRSQVLERDLGQCCYCRLSQEGQSSKFHIDHIIPRGKGGATDASNLALQCPYCSLHKSDKTTAVDSDTGEATNLFHPLWQKWEDHFELHADGTCTGLTPTGRARRSSHSR